MQNNKRYLLGMGIAGAVVLSILSVYSNLGVMNCAIIGTLDNLCNNTTSFFAVQLYYLMNIVEYPAIALSNITSTIITITDFSILLYKLIWNFILGSVIGYLYSKIKSRKLNNVN